MEVKQYDLNRPEARRPAVSLSIERQLAELQKSIPVELPEAERVKFAAVRGRAEQVAQAFADSAPRWAHGESLTQYRCRLLSQFKPHSPTWKDVDLARLDSAVLDVAEPVIYADAHKAATRPEAIPQGELREIIEIDGAGRKISRFIGHPEACWSRLSGPIQRVVAWRPNFK